MTELLSLPDLPADQVGSAQVLVAAVGSRGAVAYKSAVASYLTVAAAAVRFAPLSSPALTGAPTAPTAARGTNTTQVATTAFVTGALAGLVVPSPSVSTPADPVPLTGSDVSRALGFTPYNALNPAGFQSAGQVAATVQAMVGAVVGAAPQALATLAAIDAQLAADESAAAALTTSIAGKLSMAAAAGTYVTIADAASTYQPLLGFVPYSVANPAGYIAASGAPVQSVAGRTGAVTLTVGDVAGAQSAAQIAAAVASGVSANVSGTIGVANGGTGATSVAGARAMLGLAPVATSGSYTDLVGAPGPYSLPVASAMVLGGVKVDGVSVTANGAGVISAAAAPVQSVAGRMGAVSLGVGDVAGAAPLASPTFTGMPVIPGYLTAAAAASTYQAALGFTPYNASNPAGYQTGPNVTAMLGSYLTLGSAASTYAPLSSPSLAGAPSAPTAAAGTSTTQIATTAFVAAAVAGATPSSAFNRGTYTASGAISPTNTLAVLSGASGPLAMTLAGGSVDGQGLLIKLLGSVNATVTAVIDGGSQSVAMTASGAGTIRDALKLKWSAGDASWLAE